MLTRKHFEAVARSIVRESSVVMRKAIFNAAVLEFQADNPRFDKARFAAACGILNENADLSLPPTKR